jgi:N-acetylneuraminic acid mutarotase
VHSLAGGAASGDKIILAGGLDAKKNSTDVVWSFDPVTGTTTAAGKLPGPLHTPAVASLGSGTLVMGGAKGNAVFDTVLSIDGAGGVAAIGKLPTPRTNAVAISDGDGASVLVFGGWDGKNPTNEVLQTVDGTNFTTVATLLHPVRYPAVAMLGRSVWVIGGEYDKAITTFVQRVDLDSGNVSDVAPLPVGLSRASAFSLGNALFVAGGRTPDGRSNQIYRIDPITGVVSVAGALPEERSDATVAVSGTTAYLFGGLTSAPTDTILTLTAA